MLSEDLALLSGDRRPLGKVDEIYGAPNPILNNVIPISQGFGRVFFIDLEVLSLITLENDPG